MNEIKSIEARLTVMAEMLKKDFPLNAQEVIMLRQRMADQIQIIHDIEIEVIESLKDAM
ncbi:MAG: hypothetical protein HOH33_01190 [Verrucomicrobia bacterium]|nr:hypothetical protein [Verrucomicrobiota bacterium]